MYQMNMALLNHISSQLNIDESSPSLIIKVWRKKEGSYEVAPFILPNILSVTVDRRYNMSADECTIVISNDRGELSPDYSINKEYTGVNNLVLSGYKDVILPYNQIAVDLGYGDELRRIFTGQIQGINIVESPPTIHLTCKNEFRKLLKPIDPIHKKVLTYKNMDSFEVLKDLLERAGITNYLFDMETIQGNSFNNDFKFELGTQYSDAVKQILDTMGHRIFADRLGRIQVLKSQIYTNKDAPIVIYDDYVNLTSGEYDIDPSILRNRIIVQSQTGWKAFEDPFLLKYCNNEVISFGVESPWADTDVQKWAVADRYFLDMRRKLRRLSIGTKGNPSLDIGDLVKVKELISTANDNYMVIGIQTTFTEAGYLEVLDLELISAKKGHICNIAEGEYADEPDEDGGNNNNNLQPVVASKRDLLVQCALSFQGVPYQWGGDSAHNKNHFGMDCSHFVWAVFKKFGLMSNYTVSRDQYKLCNPKTESQLSKGDLVFYGSSSNSTSIYHVGIYIGNGQVVSASGGGPSTNSISKAKSQNAKVKVHSLKYMRSNYFYGSVRGL